MPQKYKQSPIVNKQDPVKTQLCAMEDSCKAIWASKKWTVNLNTAYDWLIFHAAKVKKVQLSTNKILSKASFVPRKKTHAKPFGQGRNGQP